MRPKNRDVKWKKSAITDLSQSWLVRDVCLFYYIVNHMWIESNCTFDLERRFFTSQMISFWHIACNWFFFITFYHWIIIINEYSRHSQSVNEFNFFLFFSINVSNWLTIHSSINNNFYTHKSSDDHLYTSIPFHKKCSSYRKSYGILKPIRTQCDVLNLKKEKKTLSWYQIACRVAQIGDCIESEVNLCQCKQSWCFCRFDNCRLKFPFKILNFLANDNWLMLQSKLKTCVQSKKIENHSNLLGTHRWYFVNTWFNECTMKQLLFLEEKIGKKSPCDSGNQ